MANTEKAQPSELPSPKAALESYFTTEQSMFGLVGLRWADTPEGATVLDAIPNPKRYIIGKLGPFQLAVDLGEPGMGIHPLGK